MKIAPNTRSGIVTARRPRLPNTGPLSGELGTYEIVKARLVLGFHVKVVKTFHTVPSLLDSGPGEAILTVSTEWLAIVQVLRK